MKNTGIKFFVTSIIRLVKRRFQRIHHRNKPLRSLYLGNDNSVLQCCIAYNEFGGFCVPLSSSHRPAVQKILSGKIWEAETIEFMKTNCAGGDIVHAGTYFGDFIPALSKACDMDAKVWAFEPNLENYRCASITIMINGLYNVEIMNAGLGSKKDSLSLMVSDENGRSLGGASKLVQARSGNKNEQFTTVEIVKVDDIVPFDRKVSIIQLDVEGFQQFALSGAIETIKRCKPILILESLPEAGYLSENILQLGYKIAGKIDANTILKITG